MSRFKIEKFDWNMTPTREPSDITDCPIDLCLKVLKLVDKNECFIVYDRENGRTLSSSMEKRKSEKIDYIRTTK